MLEFFNITPDAYTAITARGDRGSSLIGGWTVRHVMPH